MSRDDDAGFAKFPMAAKSVRHALARNLKDPVALQAASDQWRVLREIAKGIQELACLPDSECTEEVRARKYETLRDLLATADQCNMPPILLAFDYDLNEEEHDAYILLDEDNPLTEGG